MGMSLKAGGERTLNAIELWPVVQSALSAHCSLLQIPKEEISSGKQVLEIAKRIDWLPTQRCSKHLNDGTRIDAAVAEMKKQGEAEGVPSAYLKSSSKGTLAFTKSGFKWNGKVETLKEILVNNKPIPLVSSQI